MVVSVLVNEVAVPLLPCCATHIHRLWCKYLDRVVNMLLPPEAEATGTGTPGLPTGCVPSGNTTVAKSVGILSYLKLPNETISIRSTYKLKCRKKQLMKIPDQNFLHRFY